jgi:ubiquinone/menaquinone biosynthesis C-methylase UbiE
LILDRKKHWESIYSLKPSNELSWFQEYPKISIEFITGLNLPKGAKIIDIGGGESKLAGVLLEKGYTDITVLDISEKVIQKAKRNLREKADKIKWIVSDITEFNTDTKYDLWHDRATFHFLMSEKQIGKYIATAKRNINKNGYLIMGTFSTKGPRKCSGLEIKQYSEGSMTKKFRESFKKIKCMEEYHKTPFNTYQNFLFCQFQRI